MPMLWYAAYTALIVKYYAFDLIISQSKMFYVIVPKIEERSLRNYDFNRYVSPFKLKRNVIIEYCINNLLYPFIPPLLCKF